jgi:hypothetical protein
LIEISRDLSLLSGGPNGDRSNAFTWRPVDACANSERRQQEAAAAERAEAEGLAAIARAEARQKLQDELRKQSSRQMRDRQLSDLHAHAVRQEQFRHSLARASAFVGQRQRLSGALDAALALRNPPPPEPEIVDEPGSNLGSRDFNVEAWMKKPRSWW